MNNDHFLSYSSHLKSKYGRKVYKLSLDGGFTCPTRDGSIDTRGCIFCSGRGSGDFSEPVYKGPDAAIEKAKARVSSKVGSGAFIAYFQSFTGTYAPADRLRSIYTPVILRDDILELDIATRPDCLPDETIALLAELSAIKPVTVELGLQTIHPSSAEYIRRGYPLEVFDTAVRRLKAAGIEVVVHMIIGLPGESPEMIRQTAEYIGRSGADGIKFQLLHVLSGTDLAADFLSGSFTLPDLEEYISLLELCLRSVPSTMVIHRLTGDGAKRELIAPLWSGDKKRVLNRIKQRFDEDGLIQGSLW